MNRLEPILDARRRAVAAAAVLRPFAEIEQALEAQQAPLRDFRAAIAAPGLSIVAEIKRRSPSAGALNPVADARALAAAYFAAGARALSVLTESEHFGGAPGDLGAARDAVPLPILRKDFIVDPYQIAESRFIGADAILLIVAALGRRVAEFIAKARAFGLVALVEVHDERELDQALAAGADLIGINNRNLTDLSVDLATSERLIPLAPKGVLVVAESGIETRADAARMRRAGAHGLLVGSALMRASDPGGKLREFLI